MTDEHEFSKVTGPAMRSGKCLKHGFKLVFIKRDKKKAYSGGG